MKKLIWNVIIMALAMSMLAGCGNQANPGEENKKISIVTTIFPEYDWVREITKGNDNVEITMLLDQGVDLHSFQPTADDIVKVSSCDMFIYVGGESDAWVEDALSESTNKDMVVISLLDVLGDSVKMEEIVEGMEHEHHEDEHHEDEHHEDEHHEDEHHEDEHHEDEHHEDGHHHEHEEYDEHVWLSLKNATALCQYIAEEIGRLDADNKHLYEENTKNYISSLHSLDQEYADSVKHATVKTILFGDRFPFRYLVDDYGINYYAAFSGCSAETEASFETIVFLAKKVDELGLKVILQIESADGKIAETIKNATHDKTQQILTVDSMQSVTAKDIAAGTTYLEIMQSNLKVLKSAIE